MDDTSWMNDPKMKHIDKSKLILINELAKQSKGKKMKDILPLLLASMNTAKQKGVSFTNEEMEIVISVMKQNMNKEEQQKVDKIRQILSMMN